MYQAHAVMAQLNAHKWAILGLCAVAMVCNYAWFIEALRVARRDETYSMPVLGTLFWLCGDSSYLWHFNEWWHTYREWYVELFWIALVLTVTVELLFTCQLLKYGRKELLPTGTERQFQALIAAGLVAAVVIWTMLRHFIVDPLWINYFDLANVAGPVLSAGLLIRRGGSVRGTSTRIWDLYVVMVTIWFVAESLWFGPTFRAWPYYGAAVIAIGGALGMAVAVRRLEASAGVSAPQPREPAVELSPAGVA